MEEEGKLMKVPNDDVEMDQVIVTSGINENKRSDDGDVSHQYDENITSKQHLTPWEEKLVAETTELKKMHSVSSLEKT
jgi:hypothetical protein